MSFENRKFSFAFPIWIDFVCFPCLISLSRTPKIIWKSNGESVHSCIRSMWIAFSFLPTYSIDIAYLLIIMIFVVVIEIFLDLEYLGRTVTWDLSIYYHKIFNMFTYMNTMWSAYMTMLYIF